MIVIVTLISTYYNSNSNTNAFDVNQTLKITESEVDKNGQKYDEFTYDFPFKDQTTLDNWYAKKAEYNLKLQELWENPPRKSSDNVMYGYDSSFDFRFHNLLVTTKGESEGKIVKVFMETQTNVDFMTDISNSTSIAVDHMNMLAYFNEKNEGGGLFAVPFIFNPTLGVMMVNEANSTDLGIVYNISTFEKGGKSILYPDSLTIDGNYNLEVLSETDGTIYKYGLSLEKFNAKSTAQTAARFAQNKLKKKQASYEKVDIGKTFIYERLTELIGINKYTVTELYTREREDFKNMKCLKAISNYIFVGKKALTENQQNEGWGPLSKAYTQIYSRSYSPVTYEIGYSKKESMDNYQLDVVHSIAFDEYFVWLAGEDGKLGIIPKSYTYSDKVKPLTVVSRGTLKAPRSLTYDSTNKIILMLETDDSAGNAGKIYFVYANTTSFQTPKYTGITVPGATSFDLVDMSKAMNTYLWNRLAIVKHTRVNDLMKI